MDKTLQRASSAYPVISESLLKRTNQDGIIKHHMCKFHLGYVYDWCMSYHMEKYLFPWHQILRGKLKDHSGFNVALTACMFTQGHLARNFMKII